jgi:septal ring factor EnvC (AmiA/AmiB activator)
MDMNGIKKLWANRLSARRIAAQEEKIYVQEKQIASLEEQNTLLREHLCDVVSENERLTKALAVANREIEELKKQPDPAASREENPTQAQIVNEWFNGKEGADV